MFDRGAGGGSVVLEEEDISQAHVAPQVEDAVANGEIDISDVARRQRRQAGGVIGRLDDDLVCADPGHAIVKPFPAALNLALDAQSRKLIRDNADMPAGLIRSAGVAIRQNLGGSLRFMACAERADAGRRRWDDMIAGEIGGAEGAIRRDNHPASCNGVFAKVGHWSIRAGKTGNSQHTA